MTYHIPGISLCLQTDFICRHIDSNHKLIVWRIIIHGCIDGASRAVIYVKVANNNRADTMLEYFKLGIGAFHLPSRVRGDRGMENVDVANYKIASHGPDRGSFIVGRSVHNQRIERLWGESNRVVAHKFKTLFRGMELAEILCPTSKVDLFTLHCIFISRVQRSLDEFQCESNFHSLTSMGYISHRHSGVKGSCPIQHCWMKCVIRHISALTRKILSQTSR